MAEALRALLKGDGVTFDIASQLYLECGVATVSDLALIDEADISQLRLRLIDAKKLRHAILHGRSLSASVLGSSERNVNGISSDARSIPTNSSGSGDNIQAGTGSLQSGTSSPLLSTPQGSLLRPSTSSQPLSVLLSSSAPALPAAQPPTQDRTISMVQQPLQHLQQRQTQQHLLSHPPQQQQHPQLLGGAPSASSSTLVEAAARQTTLQAELPHLTQQIRTGGDLRALQIAAAALARAAGGGTAAVGNGSGPAVPCLGSSSAGSRSSPRPVAAALGAVSPGGTGSSASSNSGPPAPWVPFETSGVIATAAAVGPIALGVNNPFLPCINLATPPGNRPSAVTHCPARGPSGDNGSSVKVHERGFSTPGPAVAPLPSPSLPSVPLTSAFGHASGAAATGLLARPSQASSMVAAGPALPPPDAEPLHGLSCPITGELMEDPVMVVETGQSYERCAVQEWLAKNSSDPTTGTQLESKVLVPNVGLRQAIQAWRQAQPSTSAGPSTPPATSLNSITPVMATAASGPSFLAPGHRQSTGPPGAPLWASFSSPRSSPSAGAGGASAGRGPQVHMSATAAVASLAAAVASGCQQAIDAVAGMAAAGVVGNPADIGSMAPGSIWAEQRRALRGHRAAVCCVSWSPDEAALASGSGDELVRLWHPGSGQCLAELTGHKGTVWAVAFSPSGRLLASASSDRDIRLWDVSDTLGLNDAPGLGPSSMLGAQRGAGSSPGGALRAPRPSFEGRVITVAGHLQEVNSVAFSPDGALLLSGSDDKTAMLWDVQTARCLSTFSGHSRQVHSVAINPAGGGYLAASGSRDGTACLWDLRAPSRGSMMASHAPARTLAGHHDWVNCVRFSPDGRLLLTCGNDRTIRLWDVGLGRPLQTLVGHSAWVYAASLMPPRGGATDTSGLMAISASDDGTLRLWHLLSGLCTGVLQGHCSSVYDVAVSPSNSMLASASQDETIKLWSLNQVPEQGD